MRAYIDSSVVLRIVFGEPNPLKELSQIRQGVASELIRVECLRTADRLRIVNSEPDEIFVRRLELIHKALERLELVRITPEILDRAGQSFPTTLGTLGAIHLATCLLFQERSMRGFEQDIFFCTHDLMLERAARAMGLKVFG
jgi:predicted nucleic acid-binding protein